MRVVKIAEDPKFRVPILVCHDTAIPLLVKREQGIPLVPASVGQPELGEETRPGEFSRQSAGPWNSREGTQSRVSW